MTEIEILPTSPDWGKAPKWAKWFAIDRSGRGFFYYSKPLIFLNSGVWEAAHLHQLMYIDDFDATNWENSLQKRPD